MKIAIAQLNYHIANFEGNAQKIKDSIAKAKEKGADLVVFSEMAICGYPPQDLLEQRDFVLRCEALMDELAVGCTGIAAVVGSPRINHNPKGKKLFNSAYFLADGKVWAIVNKTLLPTYDIFDEYRYFESNTSFEVVEYQGKRIALTICEDLWDNQPVENSFAKNKLYTVAPMKELIKQQPDVIVNIAASPFSYTQEGVRKAVLAENARKFGLPVFYCNQVGAHTELVFDGGSMVLDAEGSFITRLPFFEEDLQLVDLEELTSGKLQTKELSPVDTIAKIHDALVLGVKDFFDKLGFKKATLGLSGGIDSAVTLVLAQRALGSENIRVLLMPSKYSSDHSIADAIGLADNLNIQYDIVNIQDTVDQFEQTLSPLFGDLLPGIAEENIQARTRGVLLMALSNKFGHILLNTSNKSEAAVGYGTLYGDMNGALSVIGDVYKTDVFKLARFMNKDGEIIPLNTIIKPPSAELRPDQKDSDSLPDYEVLDAILYQFIEVKKGEDEIVEMGYERALVNRVMGMVNRNEFKRFQTPPMLRISSKAFGMGRRIPLVAKY